MKQKKLAWKRESAEQLRAGDYILHRSMFGHWLIHHRTDGRLLLKATTFEEAKAACQRHRDGQFDTIIESLRAKLLDRSKRGMEKYGVGLDRPDLNTLDFLRHAQEEALDFAGYLERLIRDKEKENKQK